MSSRARSRLIKEVLNALRVPFVEKDGFEADDIIGTLATQALEDDFDVLICSGDHNSSKKQSPLPLIIVLLDGRGVRCGRLSNAAASGLGGFAGAIPRSLMPLLGDGPDDDMYGGTTPADDSESVSSSVTVSPIVAPAVVPASIAAKAAVLPPLSAPSWPSARRVERRFWPSAASRLRALSALSSRLYLAANSSAHHSLLSSTPPPALPPLLLASLSSFAAFATGPPPSAPSASAAAAPLPLDTACRSRARRLPGCCPA